MTVLDNKMQELSITCASLLVRILNNEAVANKIMILSDIVEREFHLTLAVGRPAQKLRGRAPELIASKVFQERPSGGSSLRSLVPPQTYARDGLVVDIPPQSNLF